MIKALIIDRKPRSAAIIVSTTQAFDSDNRLLTHNGAATTFDADGNLLSIASGVAPASYTYDARNRLIAAGGLTYTYDAENRRVALTDASGIARYAINPNAPLDQVLIRTAPDGTKTFYVYGLGLLHEETGSTVRYYHHDRRGDTVALTDGTGAVTDRASYGVYGELLSRTGATNTPFLFNGKWGVQTDASGLYHHRARYYHPALRRFLNQDRVFGSISDSASLNRFSYANGNPVSLIDPFGLMAQDAPNSTATTNANNTASGQLSLFLAQAGGQRLDNALTDFLVPAATGAQAGLTGAPGEGLLQMGFGVAMIVGGVSTNNPYSISSGIMLWGLGQANYIGGLVNGPDFKGIPILPDMDLEIWKGTVEANKQRQNQQVPPKP